jgi:molybdate transport repressor ModE-like protein
MDSTPRAKVWLEKNGKPLIGKGRARLLEEIDKTGSIREAASNLGLSYRYAWGMIRKMGRAAGAPLVVSSRGGKGGGSSRLSEEGKKLLGTYGRAEAGKTAEGFTTEGREIVCRAVSVDKAQDIVVLAAEGGTMVTIRGSNLAKKVSVGEEIALLMR